MIKNILLWLASKNRFIAMTKRVYQGARDNYYMIQKVDSKLVVFEAFRSTKYVDSPRAIYEYMMSNSDYDDYSFIWVFTDPEKYRYLVNSRTKVVRHESHAHYMAFARAKYWVVNGWLPLRFVKKPNQIMLQCWHGTPLKRLRYDIVTNAKTQHNENVLRDNDSDARRFDYFISPSKFASRVFKSAFNLKNLGKEDIIMETGYPRNDFLVNHTADDAAIIKRSLDIPSNKKVLLYAPTWRDDQVSDAGGYKYSSPVDFEYLKNKLADEYIILFRTHNLVSNKFNLDKYKGFIYDVSDVDNVNDLYVISDVLMTDYSSVFFDYANLHRPIIFYMYDLEHYEKDLRGFYINLDELPGDIVKTEQQVVRILQDIENYKSENYKSFNNKFNYLDDGQATKRVIDKVFKK